MERRLVFRGEDSSIEAVQILRRTDSNNGHAYTSCSYPRSFPEVVIVQKVGQGNGYQFAGRDILYYSIPRGPSEVCGEWILRQTSTCAREYIPKLTKQWSHLLHNGFTIRSIILWSIWFLQQWWRILNAKQCGWDDTRTMWLHCTVIDRRQALIEFAAWSTKELGAN